MRFRDWISIGFRIIILCLGLYLLALIIWPEIGQPKFEWLGNGAITSMDYEPDPYEKELMSISDSLPHYRYQHLADSIKNKQNLEKSANNLSMSGWGFGLTGFYKRERKAIVVYDSAYSQETLEYIPDTTYFISLGEYYLKRDHSTFRKNDTTFLRYPVITKRDSIRHRIYGRYEIKPLLVDLRDLPDKIDNPSEEKRELFIRVSKSQYTWYQIIMAPIGILIGLVLLWGVLLQIIRIIEDIVNQEVFRKKTYRRLYIIAACEWGSIVLVMIMSYIRDLYFGAYIDQAFYLCYANFFSESTSPIIYGLIAFCLGYAFRKGYQLQQEQNLTI